MAFYGVSWFEAMKIPIEVFWLMHCNMHRAYAESDLRSISVQQLVHADEATGNERIRALKAQMGNVIKFEERVDPNEGMNKLKSLASKGASKTS